MTSNWKIGENSTLDSIKKKIEKFRGEICIQPILHIHATASLLH